MAETTKKFSLYLLRDGTPLDQAALRSAKGTTLEELDTATTLPFEHAAFIVRNKQSKPRWAKHLEPHFPVDDLSNQTNSVVLLFEAAERTWALCYGNGFHLIPPGNIEPSFGLKVVANSIDPSAVKSADARTPDVISRTTRAQVSRGSQISDLGVAVDKELIKHLSGRPPQDDGVEAWARRVAGSDSLQINATWDLADIATHARFLLAQFESTAYRSDFGFIDNFRPLRSGDPLIEELDEALARQVDSREVDKISLAAPEVIDEDRLDHFKVSFRRDSEEMVELVLVELYELLARWSASGSDALRDVYIVAVDGDGGAASTRRDLRRFIAAEIEMDGSTYMLVAGQWFLVEDDYVKRINVEITGLVERSRDLALPDWPAGKSEGEYNVLAATSSDWTLLDKQLVQHGGPHQKVEIGDLLSADGTSVVHVKKMSSSATLSHLWAQGAVASQLYKTDTEFQDKVRSVVPTIPLDMADITLVYAVANDRPGLLHDELFFFSKIHLVQHLETLRLIGCNVELVKVHIK